jgi:hypothetical protein
MLHKGMVLPTLTGLALVLGLAGTNPALAQATKDKQCMELSFTPEPITNCCGAVLTLEPGRATTCVQLVTDSQERQHILIQLQAQTQGVDEDGNHYVVTVGLHASQNLPPIGVNGAQEVTIPFTEHIIATGPGPDDWCHALLHITIDANGRLTSGFLENTPDCQCVPPL